LSEPERLTIVSVDSHAIAPPEAWERYVETRFHEYLPQLRAEHEIFTSCMGPLNGYVQNQTEAYDVDGAFGSGGVDGLWDADVRIREMDREGVAAEVVYTGDPRAADLFHAPLSQAYPLEVCDAGARAYHRWAHDTFGAHRDRILLVGVTGTCADMDATLTELDWLAEHGFVGTFVPGNTVFPGMRPLSDPYYDPFWARCEALGLAVVVHAGYGIDQGSLFPEIARITNAIAERGGSEMDLMIEISTSVFTPEFFSDVRPRRPLWQLSFGGVFDRFPGLRLLLTEIRADWMPATIAYLDAVFDQHRDALPAKRKPSEYWETNGLTSLSFVHRSEVEMLHDIGIRNVSFGRDYPHAESTWPNTPTWLADAFAKVPEDELRMVLSDNVIDFLGLDRERLAAVAQRVGPTMAELLGTPSPSPELLAHFDLRGGYLKQAEGAEKLPLVQALVEDDLDQLAAAR
jgi:predicted TIM-barrel fold metal-dependent hydrolase